MIRIAQFRGVSAVSKAIRWQTWSDYSHTAIMLEDNKIVEAWQGCNEVRIIKSLSEGHTPGTKVDIFQVPFTPEEERIFRIAAMAIVGKEYDYWGIAGFLVRKHYADDHKFFCSESFAHCCKMADARYFRYLPSYKVSPGRAVLGVFPNKGSIVTT